MRTITVLMQWQWDEATKNIAMNNINQQQPIWTQPWL